MTIYIYSKIRLFLMFFKHDFLGIINIIIQIIIIFELKFQYLIFRIIW